MVVKLATLPFVVSAKMIKKKSCSPGCKCGSICQNVLVNSSIQPNCLLQLNTEAQRSTGSTETHENESSDTDYDDSSDSDEMFPDSLSFHCQNLISLHLLNSQTI